MKRCPTPRRANCCPSWSSRKQPMLLIMGLRDPTEITRKVWEMTVALVARSSSVYLGLAASGRNR